MDLLLDVHVTPQSLLIAVLCLGIALCVYVMGKVIFK
jgi:hypothetical protein